MSLYDKSQFDSHASHNWSMLSWNLWLDPPMEKNVDHSKPAPTHQRTVKDEW
jgi:hypothetical protein